MELLYLWVKKYNDFILDKGFNFSSEFIIDYDNDSKKLEIKMDSLFINNFFKSDTKVNILNISAIIGANGVGKTTILDLIKGNLCKGEGGIKNHMLIVFKDHINNILKIRYSNEINILNLLALKKKYDVKEYKITNTTNGDIKDFDETSFIFYSNIFDGRREFPNEELVTNLLNISTNNLLYKDYYDFRNPNYKYKNLSERNLYTINGTNPLVVHRKYETKRQLYFKKDKYGDNCNIEIPNQINIILNEINIKSVFPAFEKSVLDSNLIDSIKITSELKVINTFNLICQKSETNFRKYKESVNSNVDFLNYIFAKSIYFDFINNNSKYKYSLYISNLDSLEFNINKNLILELKLFFKNILSNINSNKSNFTYEPPQNELKIYLNSIIKFIDSFDKFTIGFKSKDIKLNETSVIINVHDFRVKADIINNLVTEYLNIFPTLDFIDFEWPDLSTGQKAKLNFYSRFYELINQKVNKYGQLKNNIILLIDEGELFYHPEWQKYFVSDLINYLPNVWSNKEANNINLQIIITSNSPLIISDLPKSNIIFLTRKENGKLETAQLEDQKQTFASNIHTLFTDSFFVKGGLIGEFAKNKIDYVINLLQNSRFKNLSEKQINEILSIINIIGEPVIKNKLIRMFENKSTLNLFESEKKINDLEKRVSNLEKKK